MPDEKKFLLDTNICISLLKNKYGIREKVIEVEPKNCFVSEITIAELYYGASKSNNRAELIKLTIRRGEENESERKTAGI